MSQEINQNTIFTKVELIGSNRVLTGDWKLVSAGGDFGHFAAPKLMFLSDGVQVIPMDKVLKMERRDPPQPKGCRCACCGNPVTCPTRDCDGVHAPKDLELGRGGD